MGKVSVRPEYGNKLTSSKETLMKNITAAGLIFISGCIAFSCTVSASETVNGTSNEIRIDVPVVLKHANVVFNMDHAAFSGDTPVGLAHMSMMLNRFNQNHIKSNMVAVFHGDAGYMLLDDETYNVVRKTRTGNPYRMMIQDLISHGVQIEECAVTMKNNQWHNGNLIPGVKVNSGADGRIIDLVQQGYVMLQP